MKNPSPLLSALFILVILFLTPGCLKDHCTDMSSFKTYSPIYMSPSVFRSAVKSGPARAIGQTGKIYFQNGYLFLNEPDSGIHVIDDRDPANPKNISFINIPGNIDMAVNGNILYADSYVDLVAIDISDPDNIKVAKRIENVFPLRYFTYGFQDDPAGKGMIVGFRAKDTVVKKSCDIPVNYNGYYYDAAQNTLYAAAAANVPPPAANTSLPGSTGGSTARFTLMTHYLYTVNQSTLRLYNVVQPDNPVAGDSINLSQMVETIFPYEQYLFIGSPLGMLIYEASNPEQPVFKSKFLHFYGCDPVVAQNGYAYVTIRSGTACHTTNINELDIVNLSDMNNPSLVTILPLTNPHGLAVDGDHLIVCDGTGGVRFINISDKSSPKILKTINNVIAHDAIALNGLLIVTAQNGLYQYDYHDFSNPRLLSKINLATK